MANPNWPAAARETRPLVIAEGRLSPHPVKKRTAHRRLMHRTPD